jgi:hypothetical protein
MLAHCTFDHVRLFPFPFYNKTINAKRTKTPARLLLKQLLFVLRLEFFPVVLFPIYRPRPFQEVDLPVQEFPDQELSDQELLDDVLPDEELPDEELPDEELPDEELPDEDLDEELPDDDEELLPRLLLPLGSLLILISSGFTFEFEFVFVFIFTFMFVFVFLLFVIEMKEEYETGGEDTASCVWHWSIKTSERIKKAWILLCI